jgi:hypothetical protein
MMFFNLSLKRSRLFSLFAAPTTEAAQVYKQFSLPGRREADAFPEALHLPASTRSIRIVSGCAWISTDKQDYILYAGDEFPVKHSPAGIVISALGERSLVFQAIE